ncbi:hypothetical protein F5148DRAFT_1146063 [Russula earlei]|uniref:Uncharacterized protein n=1 Tax=Russula earlei TaxID=71964 RepID=A0ACC0ULW0_9AGAM|nr:hypothetical protein F5148DRAFT_1146063 [Russula earlei]
MENSTRTSWNNIVVTDPTHLVLIQAVMRKQKEIRTRRTVLTKGGMPAVGSSLSVYISEITGLHADVGKIKPAESFRWGYKLWGRRNLMSERTRAREVDCLHHPHRQDRTCRQWPLLSTTEGLQDEWTGLFSVSWDRKLHLGGRTLPPVGSDASSMQVVRASLLNESASTSFQTARDAPVPVLVLAYYETVQAYIQEGDQDFEDSEEEEAKE